MSFTLRARGSSITSPRPYSRVRLLPMTLSYGSVCLPTIRSTTKPTGGDGGHGWTEKSAAYLEVLFNQMMVDGEPGSCGTARSREILSALLEYVRPNGRAWPLP